MSDSNERNDTIGALIRTRTPFFAIPAFVLPWASGMLVTGAFLKAGQTIDGNPPTIALLGFLVGFVGWTFIVYREIGGESDAE